MPQYEKAALGELEWYIKWFLGVHFAANWAYVSGIYRVKVNIFWDRGDFPYVAHDMLAPQPEATSWSPEG